MALRTNPPQQSDLVVLPKSPPHGSFRPIPAFVRAQRLHGAYESFLGDIARIIPVIRVNYSRFPSVEEMADMVVQSVASARACVGVCVCVLAVVGIREEYL